MGTVALWLGSALVKQHTFHSECRQHHLSGSRHKSANGIQNQRDEMNHRQGRSCDSLCIRHCERLRHDFAKEESHKGKSSSGEANAGLAPNLHRHISGKSAWSGRVVGMQTHCRAARSVASS
eukprot:scaffold168914_cov32-Tisochrysis_lutea.AAC.2